MFVIYSNTVCYIYYYLYVSDGVKIIYFGKRKHVVKVQTKHGIRRAWNYKENISLLQYESGYLDK